MGRFMVRRHLVSHWSDPDGPERDGPIAEAPRPCGSSDLAGRIRAPDPVPPRPEERYQLSFWDALIVEAARLAGAQRLLTEGLQAGRVVGGVRVEDPLVQLPASG